MSQSKEMLGHKSGLLTVESRAVGRGDGKSYWNCACECGKTTVVSGSHLRIGDVNSCGCQQGAGATARNFRHGHHGSLTYVSWSTMKRRCNNPNTWQYKYYGGRGIQVCQRWADSFQAFVDDMGHRPSKLHSIDRYPNNDGNYEPGNCRWATRNQQANNKRKTRPSQ